MKTSEKLEAVLCNPEGKCCIDGSNEDRRIIDEAIAEVKQLESARPEIDGEKLRKFILNVDNTLLHPGKREELWEAIKAEID